MNLWLEPSHLDRVSLRHDDAAAAAWADAVVIEVDDDGNVATNDRFARPLTEPGERRATDILLGTIEGRAWFARPVDAVEGEASGWYDVQPEQADPLATAVALTRWHATQPPCERCGGATKPDALGARRVCIGCGAFLFARTDPCVIVAITDPEGRLLLAHQGQWAKGRVSVIAGFMEPGESAEQACHREVAEEVGLSLTTLSYFSSQPWPMPRSLMLGFEASTSETTIAVDGVEIESADFYTRAEVQRLAASGELILPRPTSIARSMIDRWLSAPESNDGGE